MTSWQQRPFTGLEECVMPVKIYMEFDPADAFRPANSYFMQNSTKQDGLWYNLTD